MHQRLSAVLNVTETILLLTQMVHFTLLSNIFRCNNFEILIINIF